MRRTGELQYGYWALIALLLAGALSGCPLGMAPVIVASLVQNLRTFQRHRQLRAFPVQVRAGFLLLLLAGLWSPLSFIHLIQLCGVMALLVFDYCPLARILSLMPWNRPRPARLPEVLAALLTPPSAFRLPAP